MTIAYSMLNVTATLDGRRVVGLMDGDNAIQVSPGCCTMRRSGVTRFWLSIIMRSG